MSPPSRQEMGKAASGMALNKIGVLSEAGQVGANGQAGDLDPGVAWSTVEGQYMSIMAVVIPCRSHKSKKGIIPTGHLADGRMYLVLVSKCSHAQYLRFLITLTNHGLEDACLPFVQAIPVTVLAVQPVIPVTALSVQPVGVASAWNVDGELMGPEPVDIRVIRGLVDVFARGVELAHPEFMSA
eukprot:gene3168-13181_t